MQVLLRAAFHLSALRGDEIARVAIVVDSDTGIRANTVSSLLHPWRSWLEITHLLVTSIAPEDDWFDAAGWSGAQKISIVSDRPEFTCLLEDAASRHGLRVLRSDYPTGPERSVALFKEMQHHHYELGGLNEWDGAPVVHAHQVLQQLSAANCAAPFPSYLIEELRARHAALGRPVEALDIGSGSISRLRWGAIQGLLHVTGVDPLLDIYDILVAHHGLDRLPAIRVDRAIVAGAENLCRYVAADSFDFAYSNNALDHVEDPPAVIAQIARALRPGGLFALQFATREGSRQEWRQLHQFDLFLDADRGELMCQWRDGRLGGLLPKDARLVLDQVVAASDFGAAVVLRHHGRGGRGRLPRSGFRGCFRKRSG